ncbi:putative tetratricopeptide-like helical domain superfamily [Helianthus annuus]|nr:putative tetratricopeptide-like helical domain superfamily [Helianthus annuus]
MASPLPSAVLTKLESDLKRRSANFPSLEKVNPIHNTSDSDPSSTHVSLLEKCVQNNSFQQAPVIHAHIVKSGTQQDLFFMTSLVNVYGKCGAMEAARKVFDHLSKRNVVTWTSLMSGYVHNSQPEEAIHVFIQMLEHGSYPTNYTI